MNIEDINFNHLSSLVQVRSHLVFLLNNGSRSLVTKNEVRKIQNLIIEIDKYFIKQTLMNIEDSVTSTQNVSSNLPSSNEVIVTQGTVLVNPKPAETNQLNLDFLNSEVKSSNEEEKKSSVEEKKTNKKVSKKLFSRTDE